MTRYATSKDSTRIAFDRVGEGPPLILVDGALCDRGLGGSTQLAGLLAPHFSVITYDRRGRGDSSDSASYEKDREVADIAALLNEAGGEAHLWGMSSGAILSLDAAMVLGGIKKLALYEPPLILDGGHPSLEQNWARIAEAIVEDRRDEALKLFLRGVGMPAMAVAVMSWLPVWSRLRAIAHTLPYDGAICSDLQRGNPLPPGRWSSVSNPVLITAGSKSPEWMCDGNQALANALPNAHYKALTGQTHTMKPKVLAPVLIEFYQADGFGQPFVTPSQHAHTAPAPPPHAD